jgi:anti-sigma B factor antagonist
MAQTMPEESFGALPLDASDPQVSVPGARFNVQQTWIGEIVRLAVSGDVDMLTAPGLDEAIDRAVNKAPGALIVDLSDVDFLSSAGMSALVEAQEKSGASIRLAVVADSPATSRPLKLMGLDSVLSIFPSLNDAVAKVR